MTLASSINGSLASLVGQRVTCRSSFDRRGRWHLGSVAIGGSLDRRQRTWTTAAKSEPPGNIGAIKIGGDLQGGGGLNTRRVGRR